MANQVAYQAVSSRLEGDTFIFGPFDSVDLANAHFTQECLRGNLDEGSFKPFYLNGEVESPTWVEAARRPISEAPRLFPLM